MSKRDAPILVVDDDPADRDFAVDSLKIAGVTGPIETASNGQEAIDYVSGKGAYADRSRFPLPCLILLDIKMPLMDGFDVVDWIRRSERVATIPIIMLSGSGHEQDIERAYIAGANGYLVKPANLSLLAEIMKAVKAYWLDFNCTTHLR